MNFEIDRTLPPWRERAWGKAFPPDDRADFIRSLDEFFQRIEDERHWLLAPEKFEALID